MTMPVFIFLNKCIFKLRDIKTLYYKALSQVLVTILSTMFLN